MGEFIHDAAELSISIGRDQTGANPPSLQQHHIVGAHRRPGGHDVELKYSPRETAPAAAAARIQSSNPVPSMKKSRSAARAKTGESASSTRSARRGDRPGPNAVRQAKQRAAMRHAAEPEAAFAMGVNHRLLRQMRIVH